MLILIQLTMTGQKFLIVNFKKGLKMYYSFDSTDLINELEKEIAEFGNTEVWAYWKVMENGQEIYFDYFPVNDPDEIGNPEYRDIEHFDKEVAKTYPNFLRKKIKAKDLLEIFKKENETI